VLYVATRSPAREILNKIIVESPEWDALLVLALKLSERVAQSVEHRPFKALVLGSNPSPLTTPPKFTEDRGDPQ
jgi:hypothetical protein